MAVRATRVTVGTTAVALSQRATSDDREGYSIACTSTLPFFVGGISVSIATGWPVAAGEKFSADLDSFDVLYAISATPDTVVNVLLTGVK